MTLLSEGIAELGGIGNPAGVLMVDDHRENLAALTAVLEPLGQRLVAVESGEQALRALLQEEFAVILLDVRMAGLDGLETARLIRSRPKTRHVPIIFMTAQSSELEEIALAYASGAVDYVVKPFEPEILRAKVAVFVELYRERGERVRQSHARAEAEAVARTIRTLQALSDAALNHLDLDGLLAALVDRSATALRADGAVLLLRDEDVRGLRSAATRGLRLPLIADGWIRIGAGVLGEMAEQRRSALLQTAGITADRLSGNGDPTGTWLESLLVIPLVAEGEFLGMLLLAARDPDRFEQRDLELMMLAAERMATAIDHVQRYADSRQLVETLQRSLLPDQLPHQAGLELAARYLPGGLAPQIGGDWYDAVELGNGRTAVMIGDAVGHGIRAATRMSELRNALRAFAIEGHNPAAALQQLDRVVEVTIGPGMVATALFLLIDAQEGTVTVARAGHPPPALRTADGEVSFLDTEGTLPVGLDQNRRAEEGTFTIGPGDTLLLFTDGLIETRDEPITTGFQRLRDAFASAPEAVESVCDHVLSATSGNHDRDDDVALLVVRLLELPEDALTLRLPATPEALSGARHELRAWLGRSAPELDEVSRSDLELAWSEACTNVVRHAYHSPDALYLARAVREAGAIILTVRDSGSWQPPPSDSGGRGLPLMRQLCDEVVIDRGSDGTTVTMRRRVGVPAR
jgi:serine phosphatase RsbU (regulator of sigma subunit)/CheY-like chemotaxis protein/anti-sigma regulatory factor (Ser/Thr protein kinase)